MKKAIKELSTSHGWHLFLANALRHNLELERRLRALKDSSQGSPSRREQAKLISLDQNVTALRLSLADAQEKNKFLLSEVERLNTCKEEADAEVDDLNSKLLSLVEQLQGSEPYGLDFYRILKRFDPRREAKKT